MHAWLPEKLDFWRGVAATATFQGELALAELTRLCQVVDEPRGAVLFDLRLGRDAEGRAIVCGTLEAILRFECQRCLGIVEHPVMTRLQLAAVQGLDEAASLPECYEPLLLETASIRLRDLIEDELLLAVPLIPRHEDGACVDTASMSADPDRSDRVDNPFAVLADWQSVSR